MTYTTKRITSENAVEKDLEFIAAAATRANILYGAKYNWAEKWSTGNFWAFVDRHFVMVCYRDEEPVGFMAASIYTSFFDSSVILKQNILFTLPGTKAAYLLLKEFVDFGQEHADHVITMIAQETNIKARSLERHGFRKLEELYILEGKNGRR